MNPNIQNIKIYIISQLQNQISSAEIQQQLLGAGHSPDDVQQAFRLAQQELMPPVAATSPENQSAVSPANLPQANGKKRGRIKTSWILLKQSAAVLRGNPYLLRYLGITYA